MSEKMDLTPEEAEIIRRHRDAKAWDRAYNQAIGDAVRLAYSYADQCCGGSGEGGNEYRVLGDALQKLIRVTTP